MANIQQIVEMLALSTTSLDFTTASLGGIPKGLLKVGELRGLDANQINYLYAIYLNHRPSRVKLQAHLVATQPIPSSLSKYQLCVVRGAVKAVEDNGYRTVECYKCKGKGCDSCDNTGKKARKPKEYQLCGVERSTWYNKSMTPVREYYAELVTYLFSLENEIVAVFKQNKTDKSMD